MMICSEMNNFCSYVSKGVFYNTEESGSNVSYESSEYEYEEDSDEGDIDEDEIRIVNG